MIIDKDRVSLIMMVGIPASGKTFLAERILEESKEFEDFEVIVHSSDALRKELFGDINDQSQNGILFNELHNRIINDLKNGKTVVYDATNINRKRRIAFLNMLKQQKINCQKICIPVMSTYEDCIFHNKLRERSIPESVIDRMYRHFEPPILQEGWDFITIVYNISDSHDFDFYTIEQFFRGRINACAIDQENKHHTLTIGDHCIAVYEYLCNEYPDDLVLQVAGLLHDCGKPYTKTKTKYDGTEDTECHYYNHSNVGAYDSFFYTANIDLTFEERLEVAHLICDHMKPFDWINDKYKNKFGNVIYDRLIKLHEADVKGK